MSFLDKLGDFTGGFGEGLSGTILPAFEKGWDRQTKLMDKAEERDYAEAVTYTYLTLPTEYSGYILVAAVYIQKTNEIHEPIEVYTQKIKHARQSN